MPHPIPLIETNRIFATPLLIEAGKLEVILSALSDRIGVDVHVPEIAMESYRASRSEAGYQIYPGGVAVISVFGTLVHRSGWLDAMSGMVSYEAIGEQITAALEDPGVEKIVLLLDSHGGEVAGCFDLSDRIYAARGQKPMTSIVDEKAFSGCYLIGSAADEIVMPRTAGVGSIGVITAHVDESERDKQQGRKVTIIKHGRLKDGLSAHKPLDAEVEERLQLEVDRVGELFDQTVARNRGIDVKDVVAMQAGLFYGPSAVKAGLADRILSANDALAEIINPTEEGVLMPDDKQTPAEPDKTVVSAATGRQDAVAIIQACTEAGVPDMAAGLIAEGLSPADAKTRLQDAAAIRSVCVAAELPDKADGFIRAGMSVQEVRSKLFDVMVQQDERTTITSRTMPAGDKPTAPKRIDADSVYDRRRKIAAGEAA